MPTGMYVDGDHVQVSYDGLTDGYVTREIYQARHYSPPIVELPSKLEHWMRSMGASPPAGEQ